MRGPAEPEGDRLPGAPGPAARGAADLSARAVLEASPNPIVGVDGAGTIRYANSRVGVTFGYSPEELIGQPVELLLPERVRTEHAAHRSSYMAHPLARPMGIGLELAGRRKDGTELPVEISLSPLQADAGIQVFATVVDITARKAAEAALAASERRFRAVLEAAPNAIVGVDSGGRITYANPRVEATFGYRPEDLLGQPVELLIPGHLGDAHRAHRSTFMDDPVARPMGIGLDLAGRRNDGREFPVEISLSPVESSDGSQVFATIVDISARKSVEAELLQARKLESIGRLAGGIAHDFNNILYAITGYAELLEEDLAPAAGPASVEDARRNVQGIAEAARRGATLTQQLLAFSRQPVVASGVIDVGAAVRELQPMLERLIGDSVRLVLRLDASTGRIRIAPGQLDQILVNLIVNARDAMPHGGTVAVETSNVIFDDPVGIGHVDVTPGPYVMITISDTGVGMDRETAERVFEPFFTTKERGKGTGLGLATIYGIVRQAGGHIWLYSEPGMGSTFRLSFPRADAPASGDVPVAPTDGHAAPGTVVVVEDEASVREMTAQLLERAGYAVIAVGGGPEALEVMARLPEHPLVVVTDVVMPDMSGIDLAERLVDLYPRTGVVLLSGYTADILDIERVVARGVRFLTKPARGRALLEAVREAAAEKEPID